MINYRIDSVNYQDVFVFEVNENNEISTFLITGLVKDLSCESGQYGILCHETAPVQG